MNKVDATITSLRARFELRLSELPARSLGHTKRDQLRRLYTDLMDTLDRHTQPSPALIPDQPKEHEGIPS